MVNTPPAWVTEGKAHIWPPYTQEKIAADPVPIVGANGSYLVTNKGEKLLDGIASWWSMCHGYQHPKIVGAIKDQADTLSHVMMAGIAHEPAYRLAKKLVDMTPKGLEKVFFSDSGSVAVEVAMKMAFQYWHNQGHDQRNKFISFTGGYHGDTMGAMSLADPEDGMHKPFSKFMPKQYVMDIPTSEYSLAEFEQTVAAIAHTVAGMVIEPLLQGAGGIKTYSPDILAALYQIAKKYDILFIADEIATGFGRTGMMFACEEASITPDILCVGKALTGGHIGMAATVATMSVYDAFYSDELFHAFMHGPTYMGNPLACAAALASLELIEENDCLSRVSEIELMIHAGLCPFEQHPKVSDIRLKGAVGAIELTDVNWNDMFALRQFFLEQGLWLRPFGNILYTMPPYTITNDEMEHILSVMIQGLNRL